MGSSRTKDRICVPCTGRRILNHCATREAPVFLILIDADRLLSKKTVTSWQNTGSLFSEQVKPKRDSGSEVLAQLRTKALCWEETLKLQPPLPCSALNIRRQASIPHIGYLEDSFPEKWTIQETATDTESWKSSNEMLGPYPITLRWGLPKVTNHSVLPILLSWF